MASPRTAHTIHDEKGNFGVVNLNNVRTKKLFSNIKGLGFNLLSTGVTRSVVKSPLTLLNAPQGELDLKDPALLLSLDMIGQSKGLLYLSMNSSRDEIIAKLVLALSGVNEALVKKGAFLGESQEAFEKACTIIYNSDLHVAEGMVSNKMWVKLKELRRKGSIDLLIIDDMHAIGFKQTDDENSNYQDLLEHFNEMALSVGIPIVLITRNL